MLKIRTILLGFVILFGSNIYSQDMLSTISKKLYKCQLQIKPKEKDLKKSFHEIRIKIDSLNKFNSIKDADTIYFLESFGIEDGTFYGKIWNRNESIEYTYYRRKFNFNQKGIFTQYTCKLVEEWNILEICEEEKVNSTMTSPITIFGSRISFKKGKVKAKCIKFKEFYNFERDR
ncbi:MAG: hypothetical protein IMY72_07015 [Bacteroidetes bacterium]|nr:hypothetical protein [Bacteroidota bacterium]